MRQALPRQLFGEGIFSQSIFLPFFFCSPLGVRIANAFSQLEDHAVEQHVDVCRAVGGIRVPEAKAAALAVPVYSSSLIPVLLSFIIFELLGTECVQSNQVDHALEQAARHPSMNQNYTVTQNAFQQGLI